MIRHDMRLTDYLPTAFRQRYHFEIKKDLHLPHFVP